MEGRTPQLLLPGLGGGAGANPSAPALCQAGYSILGPPRQRKGRRAWPHRESLGVGLELRSPERL